MPNARRPAKIRIFLRVAASLTGFPVAATIILCSLTLTAQVDSSTAPTVWKRYFAPEAGISFISPKFPVRAQNSEPCATRGSAVFGAYSMGVGYRVDITVINRKAGFCNNLNIRGFRSLTTTFRSGFGQAFTERRIKVRSRGRRRATILTEELWLTGSTRRVRIISDRRTRRMVVLEAVGPGVATEQVGKFLAGYRAKSTGTNAKGGASATYGDGKAFGYSGISDSPVRIVVKPRAKMPLGFEGQGTVVLRVEFLKNGSIGNVTVIKSLPNGAEKAALDAVKRIVFVPAFKGGRAVTVLKNVEFSFTIY